MRQALVALLLLAALTSGCADPDSGTDSEPDFEDAEAFQDIEVTETTGAIRGVVVDEAIRPLGNVTIKLVDPVRYANTTGTGTFSFSGLDPGTYFIEASKLGFRGARQSVDVVAGDDDPPVARILLTADGNTAPYVSAQSAAGYVVCGTSLVAACGVVELPGELACEFVDVCLGSITGDKFGFYLYYEPNATMIQSEMFWDSTQALSTALYLEMEVIEGCESGASFVDGVSGDSPIYNIVNATEVKEGMIGGTCGIWHSVFSDGAQGTPVGVTLQQKFEIFSHAFYHYTPADVGQEGWRFSEDADVPQPPQ